MPSLSFFRKMSTLQSSYQKGNAFYRLEKRPIKTIIMMIIFVVIYSIIISNILYAKSRNSTAENDTTGGVYLVNKGQIARSRNFYENYPNWEDVSGDLPIPFADRGGVTEFALDPFDPINRAWISLGSPDSWIGSLWMTENLDDSIPVWKEILSQEDILSAIGGINLQVSRVQASPLQPGLLYIVVFRGDGAKGEIYVGRSEDYGRTWSWGGPFGNGSDRMVGFKVSPHVIDRLWLGAHVNRKSEFLVSHDGGYSFLSLATFETWWHPYDIFVPKEKNDDDAIILASVDDRYGRRRLMRSADGGRTWVDITYSDKYVGPTNNMINTFLGETNGLFYISTTCGGPWSFIYSGDGGQSWETRFNIDEWWSSVWQNPVTGELLTAKAKSEQNSSVAFLSKDGGYTWIDKTGDWLSSISHQYLGQPGSCGGSASVTIIDNSTLNRPFLALASDDAGENATTCLYSTNDREIYFGKCDDGAKITSGFRFQNVPLSDADEIQKAWVEFTVDGRYDNELQVRFLGEDADNAVTFSESDKPIDRHLTQASVEWRVPSSDVWTMGEKRQSPDLTAIIREIVNRPGWKHGNALSIVVKDVNSIDHRRVFAIEREGLAKAAKLIITRKYLSVNPDEIDLGTDYVVTSFEKSLTIKNSAYHGVVRGNVSADVDWITLIKPHQFSLAQDEEITIRIFGRFPEDTGFFESALLIETISPEFSEMSVPIFGKAIESAPSSSLITGSFVIAQWYTGDRRSYAALLDEMESLNMKTVILHSIGEVTNPDYSAKRTVGNDPLGWMLDEAAEREFSVYIGLYSNVDVPGKHEFWLEDLKSVIIQSSAKAVKEIENLYGTHPALKGYYIPQEAKIGGHQLKDYGESKGINPFYTELISKIHTISPGKKVIAGGYVPHKEVPLYAIKDSVQEFKSNGLDIFILQDGVGSFDNSMTTYPTIYDYFVAAREGANPKPLWAIVELFQWSSNEDNTHSDPPVSGDNWLHPAYAMRVNQQIYWANQAGASEKITWINQRHMSFIARDSYHAFGRETEHLYRGYKALYFDGTYYENPSYVCNPAPSSRYPDRGDMLFDKIEGQESLSNWVGFEQRENDRTTVTVDLGSEKPISDVTAVVRTETKNGIYYPKSMRVKVSTDGTNYTLLGSMDVSYHNRNGYSKAYLWVSAETPQTGRWIKIEFIHGGTLLLLSELDIYSVAGTPTRSDEVLRDSPKEFQLVQNYPNPFNPFTTIRYVIPKAAHVQLKIFNLAGQELATLVNGKKQAGEYKVLWNSGNISSGIYVCQLKAGQVVKTRKLLLVK